ncbi:hypothetical protein H4219_005163 [Mycoemilia scoparia]|uniref:Uncharacterized protein n=1 Tax=Mycoemilia scoparia TaxID=417184 RepID=A0A9W7ZU15_9FUNG|nr:hypothetical protein H4219_005163 [Mycoemilia scoparia]
MAEKHLGNKRFKLLLNSALIAVYLFVVIYMALSPTVRREEPYQIETHAVNPVTVATPKEGTTDPAIYISYIFLALHAFYQWVAHPTVRGIVDNIGYYLSFYLCVAIGSEICKVGTSDTVKGNFINIEL